MLPGESDPMPEKCLRMNDAGELPVCTQQIDGSWIATYPGSGLAGGAGGGFAALLVLALLVGLAFTLWKVSTARRMARDAGMDPGDATAMTLLTDDGFEAAYLASSVRQAGPPGPPPAEATPDRTPAERLRVLDSLREQGLVTEDEYAAKRRAILDEL